MSKPVEEMSEQEYRNHIRDFNARTRSNYAQATPNYPPRMNQMHFGPEAIRRRERAQRILRKRNKIKSRY